MNGCYMQVHLGVGALVATVVCWLGLNSLASAWEVPCFGKAEFSWQQGGEYSNPYVEVTATANVVAPDGSARKLPLFWDGADRWKLRISPNVVGRWTWRVESNDSGLRDATGVLDVVASDRRGGIRAKHDAPLHFQYENGAPFWFFGDTAWALFTDDEREEHDRNAVERLIDRRAQQGFNVLHAHLISEAGWGNSQGYPFRDMRAEQINPGYWQEVDERLEYLNTRGITCGLALAWGDKGRDDPQLWRTLPSLAARQRYARYIAARYGAFNVYFIVAGEWNADINSTPNATEQQIRDEYIAIGNELRDSDAHGRMIAIHPMTRAGSSREFVGTRWMSFGDYQQNYEELHERILLSRPAKLPVVNSEYAYFLRDREGDGRVDKENSATLDDIRHATWDIVMAGGYVVTGFGSTYFGGNRQPGPFRVAAPENEPWEDQVQHVPRLFTALDWWRLTPQDNLLSSTESRTSDRYLDRRVAPPKTTYWALAEPGRQYLVYLRGCAQPLRLTLDSAAARYRIRIFNPRTGEFKALEDRELKGNYEFRSPDQQDWLFLLERSDRPSDAP